MNNVARQLEFTYLSGPEEGKTFTFKSRQMTIGSARGADLLIQDRYVNAEQATITVEEAGCVLVNRAVNGATFVNGNRVERCLLSEDDVITFGGGLSLKFRSSEIKEGFQAPFRTPVATSFRIQVNSGTLKGMSYNFCKETVTIGCRRGCDLLLPDGGVDLEHARIASEGAELVLYNKGGGIKVNGQPVERRPLQNGDVIELGTANLTFEEVMADVRLAKPRRHGANVSLLQRSKKEGGGLFSNPLVLGGIILYIWVIIFFVLYLVLNRSKDESIPFGGGFGFRSIARGIYISKSIGQEFYEGPMRLRGTPGSEGSYLVVSGKTVLYDSNNPKAYSKDKWPASPGFQKRTSDLETSNRCLAVGREAYSNRNLDPGALFRCVWNLRRAEAFCPDTEATTKAAIVELLKRSEIELVEFFEDTWERAYIKTRAKDRRGAAELYDFLRNLVPDDKNPGNQYARNAHVNIVAEGE